jgi:hypothetical protein
MRLDERVRTLPRASTDCREIDVDVATVGASLTFVTRDGRKALRAVASPEELVPTAEALFVTLPPSPPPPDASASSAAPAPLAAPPRADVDRAFPRVEKEGTAVVFGASAGGRLGFPGPFASPTFSMMMGLVLSRWELGLRGQWDVAHASLGSPLPDGFRFSSWALLASIGRREPLGAASVSYGALAGVSYSIWAVPIPPNANGQGTVGNGENTSQDTVSTRTRTEPRAGLYFGASVPRRSWIRFHPEVVADAVVSRMGEGLVIDPSVRSMPWWSTTLSLMVEGEVP